MSSEVTGKVLSVLHETKFPRAAALVSLSFSQDCSWVDTVLATSAWFVNSESVAEYLCCWHVVAVETDVMKEWWGWWPETEWGLLQRVAALTQSVLKHFHAPQKIKRYFSSFQQVTECMILSVGCRNGVFSWWYNSCSGDPDEGPQYPSGKPFFWNFLFIFQCTPETFHFIFQSAPETFLFIFHCAPDILILFILGPFSSYFNVPLKY